MLNLQTLILAAIAASTVAATTAVHVNTGCILVDGKPSCNWVDGLNGGATIYARFDGGVTTKQYVVAGCKLVATWPSDWKDIYFGADNCLYDSKGNWLSGACCTGNQFGDSSGTVLNPYYKA